MDTLTTDPRGVRTGKDDVTTVREVQNTRCPSPSHPEVAGQARLDAVTSRAARTVTALMRSQRRSDPAPPPKALHGLVTNGECGDSTSPHPSYLGTSEAQLKQTN